MPTPTLPLHHLSRPAAAQNGRPPLLILLHGIGSHEGDLIGLAPYIDSRWLIVSARGPIPYGPGFAWYNVEIGPTGWIIDPDEESASRKTLITFIDEAVKAYDADPRRVVLMGFSQGAIMSYGILLTAPGKIAGVLAMSGRLLDEVKPPTPPAGVDGFPLMIQHGVADPVIPVRYARATRDYFQTLPVALTYREYPMGHHISEESLADGQAWLAERIS